MKKAVEIVEVLGWHDGIMLLFTARDPGGRDYLASMIDTTKLADYFAAVPVDPETMRDFLDGKVDIREVFLASPDGEWSIVTYDLQSKDSHLPLTPQETRIEETEHLPRSGSFLSPRTAPEGGERDGSEGDEK